MCSTQNQFILLAVFLCSMSLTSGQISFLSCGRRTGKTDFLIHHGSNATAEHWPWHVAIYHGDKYKCGGSIIDGDTILTAAHCVQTEHGVISKTLVSVHVGRANLSETITEMQKHNVMKLIVHPEFNSISVIHDIALIKLTTNITMSKSVKPVCLWTMDSKQDSIVGKNGTIVGFGFNERDVESDQLKQALIEVVKPLDCIASDRDVFGTHLTWDMFCGIGKENVSACNGDSGGGMFFKIREKWFVRGLVSFATVRRNKTLKLCDPGKPTVYTDVAKYLGWIKQYIDQRILPYESNVFDMDYEEKLRLFNFDSCGTNSSTYTRNRKLWTLPWIGFVQHRLYDVRCAVTLINEWYAVGPANCFKAVEDNVSIVYGDFFHRSSNKCFSRDGETFCSHPTQLLQIKNITKHPHFDPLSQAHNIALIEFKFPADTTQPNAKPICLPITSLLRTNATKNLHAAIPFFGKPLENSLVRYVEYDECERQLARHGIIMKLDNSKLCWTTDNLSHFGKCSSDMLGFPLQEVKIFNGKERYFLSGFNSFGLGCKNFLPAVYLNSEPYLDWILYNMRFHTMKTTNASVDQTLEHQWNMLQKQAGKEKLRLFNMDTCGITATVIRPEDHVPWFGLLFEESVDEASKTSAVLISDWYALAPKGISEDWRYLLLGKYENNTKDEVTYQLVEIKNFIIPPPDHPRQIFALIELLEPADLKIPYIRPVCLPFMERFYQINTTKLVFASRKIFDRHSIESKNITTLDKLNCQNRLRFKGRYFSAENYSCATDSEGMPLEFLQSGSPLQMHVQFRDRLRYFLYGMYDGYRVGSDILRNGMFVFDRIKLVDLEWIVENMQEKERQTSFLSSTTNERVNLRPIKVSRSKRNLLNLSNCGVSSSSNPTPWIGTLLYTSHDRNGDPYSLYRYAVTLVNEWYAIGLFDLFSKVSENIRGKIIVFGHSCYATEINETKINESCESPVQRFTVKAISFNRLPYDINQANYMVLYRLATPVNTSFPNVKPICLPIRKKTRSYDTSSLVMVSSNSYFATKDRPSNLKKFFRKSYNITYAKDRYVNQIDCRNRWKHRKMDDILDNSNHCVLTKRTSDDKCVHISPGASLHSRQMLGSSERSFLRGLPYEKTILCSFYFPTVYINTDAYLGWILENMEPPGQVPH